MRKRIDPKLPKYVAKGTSAYVYVPYVKGQKRTTYTLCSLNASYAEVWDAYEKLIKKKPAGTLEWLLKEYRDSPEFKCFRDERKSDKTIKEHRRMIDAIIKYKVSRSVFGDMPLQNITSGVVRKFLDWRKSNGGAVAGNHEVGVISKAWNWAKERDIVRLPNPCIGVTRNAKRPRQHYADDENYEGWLKYLDSSEAPGFLYAVSELAYLTRMRKIECLTALKSQVLKEGFNTIRRKGSKDAITYYSPRFRRLLKRIEKNQKGRFSPNLITTDSGKRVTVSGFNSVWQRHMKTAMEKGYVQVRFTTHDLKRKGATDSDEDATISTGNSPSMTKVYDVSKLKAKPTK